MAVRMNFDHLYETIRYIFTHTYIHMYTHKCVFTCVYIYKCFKIYMKGWVETISGDHLGMV